MGEILQAAIVEFRMICETLFLTFLILKLTNVITWSWWWVFAPLLCLACLILILLVIAIIYWTYGKRRENKTVQESN